MTPYLAAGVRRLPSALEGRMLRSAWDAADEDRRLGRAPSFLNGQGVFGFTVLGEAAVAGLGSPNPTLLNGDFGLTGADAGWTQIGAATIANGQGVLSRGSGLLSELVQTFVVPERAQALQFTVTAYQLAGGGALPPDVFEVGLLDTATGRPLLPRTALTRSDALLNLQGGGSANLSSRIRLVSGTVGSGEPLVFSIDLSDIDAGTVATLTFDLAGFGSRGSQVAVDQVGLVTRVDPIAPVAANDSYTTSRNQPLNVSTGAGVLRNDTHPITGLLNSVLVQGPANGTLTLNADGSFSYVPNAGFTGQDTFFYRASAGGVLSDLATVKIAVTAQPVEQRPPQFTAGPNQTVNENSGARVVPGWATAITAGLPTPTGASALTFLVSTDRPELFSVAPSVAADGTLSFTPAPFANGNASVTVRLQDNGGVAGARQDTSAAQVFTIAILPVNQPPTYTPGPDQSVASNAGPVVRTGWATAISAGPVNESAQTVSFVLTADRPELFDAPPTLAADGTLRFAPKAGAFGRATISIVARDNGGTADGGSDTAAVRTFTIDVVYVNQAPSYVPGGDVTVNQDSGPRVISGWATAITIAQTGAPVTRLDFIVTNDQPGLFDSAPELSRDGTLRFTPKAGAFGTAIVQIVARNDGGTANGGVDSTAPRTFSIRIAALPVIGDVTFGRGGFVWQQLDALLITSLFVTSPDSGAVSLSILEGPRWLTLDALTGRLGGSPRVGDPGISTVVIAATSTTGGVTTRSFEVGIFRQTTAPSDWLPWLRSSSTDRGFLPLTGAPAAGSGNAAQQPVRIAGALVKRVAGRIQIELTEPGEIALVEVTLAGADGILGTGDDIRLAGDAVQFTVTGSTLSVDLSQTTGPVRIQFVIRGVVYAAEVD